MRHYRVRRASSVTQDFDLIEDHLASVYRDFGDDPDNAADRAAARIDAALAYLRIFASHPYRGTEHPEVRQGLRTVTSNKFVFYFEIDETVQEVRILAVFLGGADHIRQIVERLTHWAEKAKGAVTAAPFHNPANVAVLQSRLTPGRSPSAPARRSRRRCRSSRTG